MINSGTGVQTRATGALIPTSMAVQKRSITTSHPLDFTPRETLRSQQLSGLSLNGKDYEFNAAARDVCCSPYLGWSWLRIRKLQTSGLAHCGCVGPGKISGHAASTNVIRWRRYRRFVVRHAGRRLWSYEEAWGRYRIEETWLMDAVRKPRSGCYRQCRILDERSKELVDGTNFMLALLGRRFGVINWDTSN